MARLNPRRRVAVAPSAFSFFHLAPSRPVLRAEPRQRFDLASAVRLVARRQLVRFRHAGRTLGCRPGRALLGHGRRRWFERTVGGVLCLVMRLVPDDPVTVVVQREGHEAVIEASCRPMEGPVNGQRLPGLAQLTRARERWLLDFWLWRGVARAGGGRLALVHDRYGPIGIRLILRV